MSVTTETGLRELAEQGAKDLDGATAMDLLRWADEHFGSEYVVASNMQDAVLIDMAAKVRPGVDVFSWTPATTSPRPSAPATPSARSTTST